MKPQYIIYWITTLLVCGVFTYSAQMYFRNTGMIQNYFEHLHYPTYIVIPLAIVKLIAVAMLLWRGVPWITEWSYAGLFFDAILAFTAHTLAGDGAYMFSLIALITIPISYFLGKKVRPMHE